MSSPLREEFINELVNCNICYTDVTEREIVRGGCCSMKICIGCSRSLDKQECPGCRTEYPWNKPTTMYGILALVNGVNTNYYVPAKTYHELLLPLQSAANTYKGINEALRENKILLEKKIAILEAKLDMSK